MDEFGLNGTQTDDQKRTVEGSKSFGARPSGCILTPSLIWGVHVADGMIRQDAGTCSPSPRFAESAEQNGERAGVRCFVLILGFCGLLTVFQTKDGQDAPGLRDTLEFDFTLYFDAPAK